MNLNKRGPKVRIGACPDCGREAKIGKHNKCVRCVDAASKRAKYLDNPERFKLANKQWRQRNPGKHAEQRRRHFDRNREILVARFIQRHEQRLNEGLPVSFKLHSLYNHYVRNASALQDWQFEMLIRSSELDPLELLILKEEAETALSGQQENRTSNI